MTTMPASVTAVLEAYPVMPGLGAVAFVVIFAALMSYLAFLILIALAPDLRAPLTSKDGGKDGQSHDFASTFSLMVFYAPGLSELFGGLTVYANNLLSALTSLTSLFTLDIVRVVAVLILFVGAIVWQQEHDSIVGALNEGYVCSPLKEIRQGLLLLMNMTRFLLGAVLPTWNAYWLFSNSILGVIKLTAFDCVIGNGDFILQQIAITLGEAVSLFFNAIYLWLLLPSELKLTLGMDFVRPLLSVTWR